MTKNFIPVKNLLSKGSTNAKLAKNEKFGFKYSYILYLAPYTLNSKGINICPKASKACIFACLNTAGHGAFNSVQSARINKTDYLLNDRLTFLSQLWTELVKINKQGEKSFVKIPVRLNGTSDIDWPKMFSAILKKDIFSLENIVFYDYTKVFSRLEKYKNTPYKLTFSRSEENEQESVQALKNGFNVAVVFRKELPKMWNGFNVINGDENDLRFQDSENVVVGLIAKGKAKKEFSGFVVN